MNNEANQVAINVGGIQDVVKFVRNSWIVCRSNRYAGRVYYFNTETGEAAWNLSDSEIEKAHQTTLQTRHQIQHADIPEPPEAPKKTCSSQEIPKMTAKYQQPNIYNKQIINNQFSRVPFFNPKNVELTQFNNMAPMTFKIPYTPMFNVPPNPVQWITPFTNLQLNTPSTEVFSTSMPLTQRFQNLCHTDNNSTYKLSQPHNNTPLCKKNIGHDEFDKNNIHNQFDDKIDLRHRLSNIRLLQQKKTSGPKRKIGEDQALADNNESIKTKKIKYQNNDTDIDVNYNVESIRRILGLNVELSDNWFLVADKDVFLNHIDIIHTVISSDNQCCLMIPRNIFNEIRNETLWSEKSGAHRALYFINKALQSKNALIDEEEYSKEKWNNTILDSCSKLAKENLYVVLLSSNENLKECGSTLSFPLITVQGLRNSLSSCEDESKLQKPNLLCDKRLIKITIINNNDNETVKNSSDVYSRSSINNKYCDTGNSFRNISMSSPNPKNQVENTSVACVQTDDIDVIESAIKTQLNDTDVNNDTLVDEKETETSLEFQNPNTDLQSSIGDFENVSNDCTTVEKGYSKWNRRRETSPSLTNNSCSSELSNVSRNDGESLSRNNNTSDGALKLSLESKISFNTIEDNADLKPSNTKNKNAQNDFVPNDSEQVDENNVMFEVTSQAMEDYLIMKSDEWISRFVQIMEEVLTQVLQLEPVFVLEAMPPPWTILEAVECIKRKFKTDCDIVDAATKLSNVLFETGGLRGKITNNISPQMYMKIYSYGVYLIDTLQVCLANNEDLQTAEKWLAKLLKDIQEPHLDECNNDSFADIEHRNITDSSIMPDVNDSFTMADNCNKMASSEEILTTFLKSTNSKHKDDTSVCRSSNSNVPKKTIPTSLLKALANASSPNPPESPSKSITSDTKRIIESPKGTLTSDTSPGKYNLRSSKQRQLQSKEDEKDFKILRYTNKKNIFFNNLNLTCSKSIATNDLAKTNTTCTSANVENNKEFPIVCTETNITSERSEHDMKRKRFDAVQTNEQAIVRKFTKCLAIEERLNKRQHYSDLEYPDTEKQNDHYFCDYTKYNETYDDTENDNCVEENESFGLIDDIIAANAVTVSVSVKEIFTLAAVFCKHSEEEIRLGMLNDKKIKIKKKAEVIEECIDNICMKLQRILDRESSENKENLKTFLLKMGFDDMDEKALEHFRSFMYKCLQQGDLLKDSVKYLIDATRE